MSHRQTSEAESIRYGQAREAYAAYVRGEDREQLMPVATRVPRSLHRALRLLSVSSGEPIYQIVTEALVQYLNGRLVQP